MYKLSNKRKLSYNITALLIFGLLTSTSVSYFHVKNNLHDAIYNELMLKTNTVAIKLTSWMEYNLSLVHNFADTLANSVAPIRDNDNYHFFIDQMGKSSQLDYLGFGLQEDGYYQVNDWQAPSSYDPRSRPWYQASMNAMAPVITPPHIGAEEAANIYLAVTAPILRGEKFMGAVVGEVTLDHIQDMIRDMEIDYNGFAFLIDRSGNILIQPSNKRIGKSVYTLNDLNQINANKALTEQIQEGKQYLYSFTPIKNTQWFLVVTACKNQVNKILVRETLTLLIYFLLIFVIIMAAFLFSNRRIFSPLIDVLERNNITNLPNKNNFKHKVTDRFLTTNTPGLLVIVSVDNFSSLTAAYTHDEISQLFNLIKNRMQSQLLHSSILGHFSESRFIAYMNWGEEISDRAKSQWLQTVTDNLSNPYAINLRNIHCSFSIGACCFPEHGDDIESLIDNAFSVIAKETRSGISSHGIFYPRMNQQLGNELIIISAMKSAIGNDEFYLHYQPQYDYQQQKIIGLEALIRWNSQELGRTVSPGEFIPIAENFSLIIQLGDFVIDSALRQISQWNDEGLVFGRISINISPQQLLEPGFTESLLARLKQYKVIPQQLELEITETSVLENPDQGIAILNQLAKAGFHITIDDFGTGYCSLEYLKLMPIDKLKIDRIFIRDLAIDNKDQSILKVIVDLAAALDYQLLAEGVETKEQLDILSRHGCDVIQGYYYSKPLIAKDVQHLLHCETRPNQANPANASPPP